MKIIDGKAVAEKVINECKNEITILKARGITPGLAVVLIGDDPASKVYVGSKARKCEELGIYSLKIEMPADATQEQVMQVVEDLNGNAMIDGILVQSPPPAHIDEDAIVRAIDPAKDVDGFHPVNVAKLVLEDPTGFIPCTPHGCMRLLEEAGVVTSGAEVVVIGRSMIVGKPMALLLMSKSGNATVTVAHSRTKNLAEVCRRADIIIAAIGKPEFVTAEMVLKVDIDSWVMSPMMKLLQNVLPSRQSREVLDR
jgi:methylenetetrahydrofolate dehydrogenase (NADP+) / methenyltetrahydrofolate cyclohydrolase